MTNLGVFRASGAFALAVAVIATATGCKKSATPTQPSSQPSSSSNGAVSETSVTASISAPRPLTPPPDAPIRNLDQPVTLVVANAVVTRGGPPTYTFEVARDAGFTSKSFTQDGVVEGSGGQTSLTITRLDPDTDFYWHVRAQGGGTVGLFSATRKFTIGPAVVIGAPIPLGPVGGMSSGWPTFTVTNATHSGTVGPLQYKFEIASAATFASAIFLSGMVYETPNQTSFTPPADQPPPPQPTVFWRATAKDGTTGVTGPTSSVVSFTFASPTRQSQIAQQEGLTLWPGIQPSGPTGQATMAGGWDVQNVRSFNGVAFTSPRLEVLQIFDLLDRGFAPDAAINWMKSNGYPTSAAYYPGIVGGVIGFAYEYIALTGRGWELTIRVGA